MGGVGGGWWEALGVGLFLAKSVIGCHGKNSLPPTAARDSGVGVEEWRSPVAIALFLLERGREEKSMSTWERPEARDRSPDTPHPTPSPPGGAPSPPPNRRLN